MKTGVNVNARTLIRMIVHQFEAEFFFVLVDNTGIIIILQRDYKGSWDDIKFICIWFEIYSSIVLKILELHEYIFIAGNWENGAIKLSKSSEEKNYL